jgi:transmembrane sensor
VERATAATEWWPEERQDAVERRIAWARRNERGRRPAVVWRWLATGAALATVAALFVPGVLTTPPHAPAERGADEVVFSDGSVAKPAQGTSVRELSSDGESVVVAMQRGRAEFHAAHGRGMRVEVGSIAVEVRGTVFRVDDVGERVGVSVLEGRATVSWADGRVDVVQGQSGTFPPSAPEPVAVQPRAMGRDRIERPRRAAGWRQMARARAYDSAYRALEASGRDAVADEPADLLLAADVARLSHHPERAVWPLERLVDRHAGDHRAPAAAFTLGRVLLEHLHQPAAAAEAFARARALSPHGALGEHALVREIDARLRASDRDGARALGHTYRHEYAGGTFSTTVDKLLVSVDGR